MEHFIIYSINKDFKSLCKNSMLNVLYDIITRDLQDDFYYDQLNEIVEKIDKEELTCKLIEEFSLKRNFVINDKHEFILKNNYSSHYEKLIINDNSIYIESNKTNSLFLQFISMYYPELIVLDEVNKELKPISLVNLAKIM